MERENKRDFCDPKEIEFTKKALTLYRLYNVIIDRKINPKEGSYNSGLFKGGIDRMLKKIGEEAGEVIIAAKNDSIDEFRYEVGDLLFHTMIVMVEKGLTLEELFDELESRKKE